MFNCTVSNHSSDAILIACQAGFHGGLPQNFSLHFYEESNSSGRLVVHQIFAEPIFLLSSLKTNMRYKASIASVNAKGKSEDVVVEISTLKEPERQLEVKPGKSTGSISFCIILYPTHHHHHHQTCTWLFRPPVYPWKQLSERLFTLYLDIRHTRFYFILHFTSV